MAYRSECVLGQETCQNFVKRIEKRAVEKKKEMDAEVGNPLGPGGLDPMEARIAGFFGPVSSARSLKRFRKRCSAMNFD